MMKYQSLSQVTYKIDNNELVCYTFKENREIAIIFLEHEKYIFVLAVKDSILELKENRIIELEDNHKELTIINNTCVSLSTKQLNEIKALNNNIDILNRKIESTKNRYRIYMTAGITATILYFILK
jgi:hypothetical protein